MNYAAVQIGKCIETDLHIKVQQVRDQKMDTHREIVFVVLFGLKDLHVTVPLSVHVHEQVCPCVQSAKKEQISDPVVAEARAPSCDVTVNDSK